MYDIVYVLRNGVNPDELTYSLRSVEKNFPYNRIFIFGGSPQNIKVDYHIPFSQEGVTKMERMTFSLVKVCQNEELSDDFWLFNDDFYVLSKVEDLQPIYNKTLVDLATRIETRRGRSSVYTRRLRKTSDWLLQHGYKNLSYEVHLPMLFNKEKLLPIVEKFSDYNIRSLYGNMYKIGGLEQPDIKIEGLSKEVDPNVYTTFLSTNDKSFHNGKVGEWIRNTFNTPSKYEI